MKIRRYRYTDEWRQVRDDVPDARVDGVIAQDLAKCSPSMPRRFLRIYKLEDKNFYRDDGFLSS